MNTRMESDYLSRGRTMSTSVASFICESLSLFSTQHFIKSYLLIYSLVSGFKFYIVF